MKTVYLAGPITGCTYKGCTDWRTEVAFQLHKVGILGLSPMRAKAYLSTESQLKDVYNSPLSCERGITTRDRFDATTCDVLMANLLGSDRVSVGTMIELGWADANRIPIILVIEREGNVHDHGMVRELAGFRVDTLDKAIDVAQAILHVADPAVQH